MKRSFWATALILLLAGTLSPLRVHAVPSDCRFLLMNEAELREDIETLIAKLPKSFSEKRAQPVIESLREAANVLLARTSTGDELVLKSFKAIQEHKARQQSFEELFPVQLTDQAVASFETEQMGVFGNMLERVSARVFEAKRLKGEDDLVAYITEVTLRVKPRFQVGFQEKFAQLLFFPKKESFDGGEAEFKAFQERVRSIQNFSALKMGPMKAEEVSFYVASRPTDSEWLEATTYRFRLGSIHALYMDLITTLESDFADDGSGEAPILERISYILGIDFQNFHNRR